VDLGQDGEAVAGQALDDVALPERAVAVERAGDDPGDELLDLLVRAGWRDRRVPDVELEVEVGVLDPERVVEAERDVAQPTGERFEQREPALDLRPPLGEGLEVR